MVAADVAGGNTKMTGTPPNYENNNNRDLDLFAKLAKIRTNTPKRHGKDSAEEEEEHFFETELLDKIRSAASDVCRRC